jgi:hypothetical protein
MGHPGDPGWLKELHGKSCTNFAQAEQRKHRFCRDPSWPFGPVLTNRLNLSSIVIVEHDFDSERKMSQIYATSSLLGSSIILATVLAFPFAHIWNRCEKNWKLFSGF